MGNKYSIVIPCYKSSATIQKVVEMSAQELEKLGICDYEFILVNDSSPDEGKTIAVLRKLNELYHYVTVVDLAKNAGQHNAIMAGLHFVSGSYVIGMDDDMQTHPSQIQFLIKEIDKGYDVVYGFYPQKKHSFFRNLGSKFNYWTSRLLLGKPKDIQTSSFWIMKRFVADNMLSYTNSYAYLQGLVLRTTKNISCIPIQHFEREVGTSTYTLKALIRLWSSILGFSIVPLRLASYMGYLFSFLGIFGSVSVIVMKILNPKMAIGWPSVMCALLFFSGINLLFIGLVGEYVGRVFLSLNKEPQYVVRKIYQARGGKNEENHELGCRDLSSTTH